MKKTRNKLCPVAHRFAAAAATYDLQPGIQTQVVRKLAARLGRLSGQINRVLEIGCGTGLLTIELCRLFPLAQIKAVDIAGNMLDQVRSRLPKQTNLQLFKADLGKFVLPVNCSLVTSSSALHWMSPLDHTFRRIKSFLTPNGSFVFAMMVQGTLMELQELRAEIAPNKPVQRTLPETRQVIKAMRQAGFIKIDWKVESSMVRYASSSTLLQAIHRQGVTGGFSSTENLLTRSELLKLQEDYNDRYKLAEGGVGATYKVLFAEAQTGMNGEN